MEKDNSLIKSIEDVFRSSWDMPALTDWGGNVTYTYGDVATRVCYIHFLLEVLGIKPGDKVAVCDKNSGNWVISMLAIITYRAVAVPLLPDFSKQQLKVLCEHCEAKFLMGNRQMGYGGFAHDDTQRGYRQDRKRSLSQIQSQISQRILQRGCMLRGREPGRFDDSKLYQRQYRQPQGSDALVAGYCF